MIWDLIKKSAGDIWEELFHAVLFNIIWLAGSALIIPWPYVTFGLFFVAKDIGDGKGMKVANFFKYGRQMLKPAYIWGGINLAIVLVVWLNIQFYASFSAGWAGIVWMFLVAMLIFWALIQLIALAIYPRLVEPRFKLAQQNALVIMAHRPVLVVGLVGAILLVVIATALVYVLVFALSIVAVAIIANNFVAAAIKLELGDQPQQEPDDLSADY